MPTQRSGIRHNDVVTDMTIMCHMRVSHKKIITTNRGHAAILSCATINGAKLTKDIVITNGSIGDLASIFFILRILTDR